MAKKRGPGPGDKKGAPVDKKKTKGREEEPELKEEPAGDEESQTDAAATVDPKTQEASQLLTALLIVAFSFIFVGILLTWHHMHKHYDTPFLGMVKKGAGNEVKDLVAKEMGAEVAEEEPSSEEKTGEEAKPDDSAGEKKSDEETPPADDSGEKKADESENKPADEGESDSESGGESEGE